MINCQLCDKTFKRKSDLSQHLLYAHIQKDIQVCCDICGNKFKRKSDLSQHLCKSHKFDDIQLKNYYVKFVSTPNYSSKLEELVLLHFPEVIEIDEIDKTDKLQCQVCGKRCNSKKSLNLHIAFNHKDLKFGIYWDKFFPKIIDAKDITQCQLCGYKNENSKHRLKGFSNHILQQHKNITWGEYKQKYIINSEDFRLKYRKSDAEEIQECELCKERYSKKGFPNHLRSNHEMNLKEYGKQYLGFTDKCLWCGSTTKFIGIKKGFSEYCPKCLQDSKHPTQTKYWMRIKGFSEEEATIQNKKWRHENMPAFDEYYIKRNLPESDHLAFVQKWNAVKNIKRNNFSKVSQELYREIYSRLPQHIKDMKIYFASKQDNKLIDVAEMTSKDNNEYQVWCLTSEDWKILGKSGTFLDFYIKDLNINIEFDGTYWHKENEDDIRDEWLKTRISDIKIIRVTEADYYLDKEKVINRCLSEILYK